MAATPPGKTPKIMSSRLMTMKFMQRAVASNPSPSAAASSPSQSIPATPGSHRSSKRRKISPSPSHSPSAAQSDRERIQAALAEEEAKRQRALERQGADAGETKWVLSFADDHHGRAGSSAGRNGFRVVPAGWASLDGSIGGGNGRRADGEGGEEEEVWRTPVVGRRVFGKFRGRNGTKEDGSSSSADSSDDDEEGDGEGNDEREGEDEGEEDETGVDALVREEAAARAKAERKAKRKADKAESKRMSEERRKKTVRLNDLSSISGGGAASGGRDAYLKNMTCRECGEKGHMAKDCPGREGKRERKRGRDEEG